MRVLAALGQRAMEVLVGCGGRRRIVCRGAESRVGLAQRLQDVARERRRDADREALEDDRRRVQAPRLLDVHARLELRRAQRSGPCEHGWQG